MLAPDPIEIPIVISDKEVCSIRMAACGGRDQVVKELIHKGWLAYESPLPKLLSILVRSHKISFLDVGANTGYYTLLAAALGSEEVRSYEPVPQICEIIRCNIFHTFNLHHHSISIYPIALSNLDGEDRLFVPDPSHGLIETSSSLNSSFKKSHAYNLRIVKSTLDTHIRENPLNDNTVVVIKIDVESHEPEVLEGASSLIDNRRPIVIAEILPGFRPEWFENWANQNNYDHYILDSCKGAIKSNQVRASAVQRDHLFVPQEFSTESLLKSLN